MKATWQIDSKSLLSALKKMDFTAGDLLNIEGAGAWVVNNGERMRVPVDTGATRASVKSHIDTATDTIVIDDIGPETDYAYYIEYGVRSRPSYPIQPFIRPTVQQDFDKVIKAIGYTFGTMVMQRWPR